jgi:hypothetical protein
LFGFWLGGITGKREAQMATAAATQSHEEIVVSLGTPIDEADAAAVAAVMRAFVTLIEAASDTIAPEVSIKLKALPFKRGSFQIPFELIGLAGYALANADKIKEVLQALKTYFEIRVLMRGKPIEITDTKAPIRIENLTINNNDGTINLLINPQVNRDVSDAAKAVEADKTIDGVRVLQGAQKTPLIELKRDEIKYLRQDDNAPTIAPPCRDKELKNARLVVRSPDLVGNSMWRFSYKKHKIEASIQDSDFVKAVQKGEKAFTGGTQLVGDVKIHEEFDPATNKYVPTKYTITRVDHLEQQKQLPHFAQDGKAKGSRGKDKGKRIRKEKK